MTRSSPPPSSRRDVNDGGPPDVRAGPEGSENGSVREPPPGALCYQPRRAANMPRPGDLPRRLLLAAGNVDCRDTHDPLARRNHPPLLRAHDAARGRYVILARER